MTHSLFLRQQLEHIQTEVVEQDFPEKLMASGQAVPISSEIPAGAETYSYKLFTMVGEAAILANGSDDVPLVNGFVEKRTGYVRTIVDGFEYTIEDLEAAQFAGMNLDAQMGVTAREMIEQKIDALAYTGDTSFGLLGLLNHPNVPLYTLLNDGASNGGTASTRFRHKTAEQIYRDLVNFASAPRITTNGVESLERIGMSQEAYDIILSTPYPTNSASGETILSFFLKTQRMSRSGVQEVIPMPYLAGKGAGGLDIMIGYRPRLNKIKLHLPLDFSMMPVQTVGFKYRIPCRAKTAGIQITKALSVQYSLGT